MAQRTNDQRIFEQAVKERFGESSEGFSFPEFFAVYAASKILSRYGLTHEEIADGMVGDGESSCIDSIYAFVNGELLKKETPIDANQRGNRIELVLIQSKATAVFRKKGVETFESSVRDLLDPARFKDLCITRYPSELVEKVKLFKAAHVWLSKTSPTVEIRCIYATMGTRANRNIFVKAANIGKDLPYSFGDNTTFSFDFLGALELLAMKPDMLPGKSMLEVGEPPLVTPGGNYSCLVSLSGYYDFLSGSGILGSARIGCPAENSQGGAVTADGMQGILDAWYLNNGVTILASKADFAGNMLIFDNPQIIAGLRLSLDIYRHLSNVKDSSDDDRTIIVRVICKQDKQDEKSVGVSIGAVEQIDN